jgi:hypothetical protein
MELASHALSPDFHMQVREQCSLSILGYRWFLHVLDQENHEVVIKNLLTSMRALKKPNLTEILRYEGIRCITDKISRQITMKNEQTNNDWQEYKRSYLECRILV